MLLVLVMGLSLAVLDARPAHACSCAASRSNEEAFRWSDAVFSGEVVDIGELPPEPPGTTTMTMPFLNPVTFDVKEAWKGVALDSVVVHGQGTSASCGLDFERGETYLVFAGRISEDEDTALQTDYCGNTFAASEETARNILGPPPARSLPETGGVPPDSMKRDVRPSYAAPAAMLTLALAGALLVERTVRKRRR